MSANRTNKKFLSDVDSKDLIREIKCRPGLYNTSMLPNPRKDHKQQLWQEVGERLTESDLWDNYSDAEREARIDEIREKWRHLRNNFLREIKLMKSGEYNKKRKYIFFDDMEFMTPFVGVKVRGPNKVKRESKDYDSCQETTHERKTRRSNKLKRSRREDSSEDSAEDTDAQEDNFDRSFESNDDDEDVSLNYIKQRRVSPRRPVKPKTKDSPGNKTSTPKQKLTKEQEVVLKRFEALKKFSRNVPTALKTANTTNATNSTTANSRPIPTAAAALASSNASRMSLRFFDMRDSDISFCMSMVSTFRKLGETKKLRAKIDMLKVLHKYAEDLEETKPKQQQHQPRNKPTQNNTSAEQVTEDEPDQSMEDHNAENGTNVKSESKNNGESTNNVWWT